MDILQCILWISLVSTSAHTYNPYFNYYNPETRLLRVDHSSIRSYNVPTFERPSERREERNSEWPFQGPNESNRRFIESTNGPNERAFESPDERPTETHGRMSERRANERSIAVNSGIQRVQEQEKMKRTQPREETGQRYENGSYKVVNRYPSHSIVMNTRGASVREPPNADSVVFPGPTSQDFVPEIPAECEELGICENIPNYPKELVDSVIAQLGDKRDWIKHIDVLEPELTQRFGRPEENIELCNFKEKVMMPQAALHQDGEWKLILNQKEKPLQGYRVEVCKSQESSCANGIATFQKGYNATCRQKYVQRTMTALDVKTKEVFDMPFRIPSCCSCVATHIAK